MTKKTEPNRTSSTRVKVTRLGFTLIELLVVIAIISILATILLPSLNNAVKLARGAACKSNQHNISLGINMYANDYNGWTPPSQEHNSWPRVWANYLFEKEDYMENPNDGGSTTFQCPSLEPKGYIKTQPYRVYAMHSNWANGALGWQRGCFQIQNGNVTYEEPDNGGGGYIDWGAPVEFPLIWDSYHYSLQSIYGIGVPNNACLIHKGAATILFADGHVENSDIGKLEDLYYLGTGGYFDENFVYIPGSF